MERVSNYVIIKKCKDGNYALLQSYTGAVDIVSNDIGAKILKAKNTHQLKGFSEQEKSILFKRGYLTTKDKFEEKQILTRVCENLKSIQQKHRSITIIPSYNCNFRCSYCFEKSNFRNREILKYILTKEMIDDIFSHIKKMKNENYEIDSEIVLFGGEPLIAENRKNIEYIVKKALTNGYSLFAVTNGYDLDQYIDLLGNDGIRTLQITLDGDKMCHDKRRFLETGEGTYQKICHNVDAALDKGTSIIIRSNVDMRNLQQVGNILDNYKNYGWTQKKNFSFYFKNVNFEQSYCSDEYAMTEIDIIKMLNEKGIPNTELMSSTYHRLDKNIRYLLDKQKMMIMKPGYCGATNGMLVFDPLGDVYSCWNLVGNRECKIGEWDKEEIRYNKQYKKWNNRMVSNIAECSDCEYALLCGGGCAAYNIDKGYKPNCEDFKELFDNIFLKVVEEKSIG